LITNGPSFYTTSLHWIQNKLIQTRFNFFKAATAAFFGHTKADIEAI